MSLLELMTQQTAGESDSTRKCAVVLTAEATEEPRGDEAPVETALYVASNLDTWETKEPHLVSRDTTVDGISYRRLDPVAFDGLRTRFNRIHGWALERFGEQELLFAVRRLDPKAYSPPTSKPAPKSRLVSTLVGPYVLSKDGNRFFTETVAPSAVAKVNAIRDRALALGWNELRLYQNRGRFRFPCGGDYCLVCFLGEDRRVGEVTQQHIEILFGSPSRESRWRFYNPDVAQPWMSRPLEENQCLSARAVKG